MTDNIKWCCQNHRKKAREFEANIKVPSSDKEFEIIHETCESEKADSK